LGGIALAGSIGGIALGVWASRKYISKKPWVAVVGGLVGWQVGTLAGGLAAVAAGS
jgi:hypothetical protein